MSFSVFITEHQFHCFLRLFIYVYRILLCANSRKQVPYFLKKIDKPLRMAERISVDLPQTALPSCEGCSELLAFATVRPRLRLSCAAFPVPTMTLCSSNETLRKKVPSGPQNSPSEAMVNGDTKISSGAFQRSRWSYQQDRTRPSNMDLFKDQLRYNACVLARDEFLDLFFKNVW